MSRPCKICGFHQGHHHTCLKVDPKPREDWKKRALDAEARVAELEAGFVEVGVTCGFYRGTLDMIARPELPRNLSQSDQELAIEALAWRYSPEPKG